MSVSHEIVRREVTRRPELELENFVLIAHVWEDPKAYDVTKALQSITWNEDAKVAAESGTFVFESKFSGGEAAKILAPGNWLDLYVVWRKKRYHRLRMQIWSRELSDLAAGSITVEALDFVSFLQRAGQRDWTFKKDHKRNRSKGWTATEVVHFVCNEYDIPVKMYPSWYKIPFMEFRQLTPYEVIVKALTQDRAQTGTRWRIRADGTVLSIHPLAIQREVWDFKEGQNLIGATWSEDLSKKKTEVLARSVSRLDGQPSRTARVYTPDFLRYGQLSESLDYNISKSPKELERLATTYIRRHRGLNSRASLTALGIPFVRASDAIHVEDSGTGLNGEFYISSVTHTIDSRGYTMSMEVDKVVKLPASPLTKEELTPGDQSAISVVGNPAIVHGSFINPLGRQKYTIISNVAGHKSRPLGNWQSDCAIDMAASPGTPVIAVFAGEITKLSRTNENVHSGNIFGASITLTARDGTMSAFYTHVTNVRAGIRVGTQVQVGTELAEITRWNNAPASSHLHFAVREGLPEPQPPSDPNNGRTVVCTVDPEEWLRYIDAQEEIPLPASGARTADASQPLLGIPNTADIHYYRGPLESTPRTQMAFGADPTGDYWWANEIANVFGLVVSSSYRSPRENIQVEGSPGSRHMVRGAAADLSGSASNMRRCAEWAIRTRMFAEVFYDPLRIYWDTGLGYAGIVRGAIGGHSDHDHLSYGRQWTRESLRAALSLAPRA